MSAELAAQLDEAARHFVNNRHSEAAAVLAACPDDDPKVQHNLAVVEYMKSGGNHSEVVRTLSSVPGIGSEGWVQLAGLAYEGHEIAVFNKAVILLHCGDAEGAAQVLEHQLGPRVAQLPPTLQVRIALVLQIATMPTGKSRHRTRAQEELITRIIGDKANQEAIAGSEALKAMTDIALSDGSTLHEWFRRPGTRTRAEAALYFNNLGVTAMNDGKPGVASLYFTRAAKEAADAGAHGTFTQSVMYNAGLCSLSLANFSVALECFKHCQHGMRGAPMLWVRVAQACVGLFTQSAEEEAAKATTGLYKAVSEATLGSGKTALGAVYFAHLPTPELLRQSKLTPQQVELLAIAGRAVTSALCLLPPLHDIKSGGGSGSGSGSGSSAASSNGAASAAAQCFQYAHAIGAFVCLSRADHGAAYAHCQQLLSLHHPRDSPLNPDVHTSALNYAAEALCHLNRPELALKTLQASNLADLVSAGDRATPEHKHAVEALFVNLCIAHILNGSWRQAQNVITSITSKFTRGQPTIGSSSSSSSAARAAAILEVYMELALGNHEKALEVLSNRQAIFA